MGLKKEKLKRMAEDGDFVELPLCPYCGELTNLRGEFTPCCGEETDGIKYGMVEFARLTPVKVGYFPSGKE